ncbi:MAG: GDP-mannose 4,6-dehydratase [Anaerolineaceae bacterium]|nr:GDP-mannose 4,6-dehydratase [Anaerolineaceae bacterium]
MKSYLVTGTAGFIGSRVVEMLIAEGNKVFGVDNMSDAYDVRMKEYRLAKLMSLPDFKFLQRDISDRGAIKELSEFVTEPQAVINLAAISGVRNSLENPWSYVETNTIGTLNMLEYARINGIKKFILASTSSLYGNEGQPPYVEEDDTEHPLQPYAASKKGAEVMAHSYHHLYGIDVTVFRYFTVYGPAGRPEMVMFRFCQWIAEGREVVVTGNGEQSRGFTYVDDIARGTIAGLKPVGYEVFNLGGHEVASVNQVIKMIEERLGRKANIRFVPLHKADVLRNVADVSKATRLLSWKPQMGLEQGVTNLVDWYLQEREWVKDIATP